MNIPQHRRIAARLRRERKAAQAREPQRSFQWTIARYGTPAMKREWLYAPEMRAEVRARRQQRVRYSVVSPLAT